MADGVFNIAKGRVNEYANRVDSGDPSTARLQLKLLQTAEADATLQDYDTFAAILVGSNSEATFTNYATITVAAADVTITTDDTGNTQYYTIADQTWTSAGGASNNDLAKLIVCYDALGTDVDANLIPL